MKASDLMDAIGQASDERILEVVSHMEKNIKPMKPKRKIYHTILIAAVLVALFTTTAFATGFFGLEAVLIPGSRSAGDGDEAETSAMLSFSLPYAGPENFMDWTERCLAVKEERSRILEEEYVRPFFEQYPGLEIFWSSGGGGIYYDEARNVYIYEFNTADGALQSLEASEEEHEAFTAFSEELDRAYAAVTAELVKKYGLVLPDESSMQLLCSAKPGQEDSIRQPTEKIIEAINTQVCHGPLFNGTPLEFDKFYWGNGGSFGMDLDIALPDGVQLNCYVKNTSFNEFVNSNIGHWVNDVDSFACREYTAADGTALVICQNEAEAIIYAYLDGSYLVISVQGNAWDGYENVTLTDDYVNFAADFFNYSNIGIE